MTSVNSGDASSIQTRPSLLNRLKTGDDAESWQEFYRVYGKLVRDFAIQAGLTDGHCDGEAPARIPLRSKGVPVQDVVAQSNFVADQGSVQEAAAVGS